MAINVLVKKPGEQARRMTVPNTLKSFQSLVGGYIETVTLAQDVLLICNEEGRINDMKYNTTIYGIQFFGPIVIAGINGEEFADLTYDNTVLKILLPQLWEVA